MKKQCGFAVSPYKGSDHWKWKGGVAIVGGSNKYRAIQCPDHPHASGVSKYVFEHRLVMEKILGRYLETNEKVHHINGDTLDNRPENLIVLSHRIHMRGHMCKKGANHALLDDKEWLASKHTEGLNTNQIAALIGCAAHAVRHALDRLGIKKIVSENGHIPQKFPELRDKEWLSEKTKTMSQTQIAKLLGCDRGLVNQFQKRHGIKSPHKALKFPQLHDPEWLRAQTILYSQRKIAKMLGCDPRLVHMMQKQFGFKSSHKHPGHKTSVSI